jgi:hypothetical protein
MVIANLCLVAGLLPRLFPDPAGQQARILMHAASGMLLGISITLSLFSFRFARRCTKNRI